MKASILSLFLVTILTSTGSAAPFPDDLIEFDHGTSAYDTTPYWHLTLYKNKYCGAMFGSAKKLDLGIQYKSASPFYNRHSHNCQHGLVDSSDAYSIDALPSDCVISFYTDNACMSKLSSEIDGEKTNWKKNVCIPPKGPVLPGQAGSQGGSQANINSFKVDCKN
ncbi:MAG: hypothetical protein M1812_004152 [Candelaria pacifica]|nr:MAG: hypothetical protein M1812_004152 [Candelaria pacifica]